MELLFFLVILGIQFAYQIYIAINKRKVQKSISSDSSESSPFPQDESKNSDYNTTDFPGYEDPDPSNQTDKKTESQQPSQVKNLYQQFFGFINELEDAPTPPPSSHSARRFGASPEYATYQVDKNKDLEGSQELSEELLGRDHFSYDDTFEEGSVGKTYSDSPSPTRKVKDDYSDEYAGVKKSLRPSTQARIRRQLRSPQTLKDGWRIKFILDRPKGLTGKRNFF